MILHNTDRVLVQGITGKQGTFWTEQMQAYGTNVVGGVNPKKAGETHCGVPVYATAKEAAGFDVSVMFIPPGAALAAAEDAIEAGAKMVVILTEHIPSHDVMRIHAAAKERGTRIVGPNTAGLVTPGECFVGIMPAFNDRVFKPGSVGVVSRSGSLGTLICLNLVGAGFGESAFIGIGGDPMIGTTTKDALEAFENDPNTEAVVLVGEIGGGMEEEAAQFAATMTKPVVSFIAGAAAPVGKKMGHAGAIVMGNQGSYASKRGALEQAGVTVVDTPSLIPEALKQAMGSGRVIH
ncbi:MAG: succinate--CoA ligase subunit alpha [Alphaproteobacteria bacterium]|nr:succinate--CoA ligase subunit alpha [Alphaproteobacteria bacterium]